MSLATSLCNVPVRLHGTGVPLGVVGVPPVVLECTRRALHHGDHHAWMIGECNGVMVRIEVSWPEPKREE